MYSSVSVLGHEDGRKDEDSPCVATFSGPHLNQEGGKEPGVENCDVSKIRATWPEQGCNHDIDTSNKTAILTKYGLGRFVPVSDKGLRTPADGSNQGKSADSFQLQHKPTQTGSLQKFPKVLVTSVPLHLRRLP
jgi:hypothetical protein